MPLSSPARQPDSFLPLGPDLFEILLALNEGDLHGYGIVKAVEASTGGRIVLDPSPLYRRLKRLLEAGVVAEAGKRPVSNTDDTRRKYYCISRLGKQIVRAEAARLVALADNARIQALAADARRG